MSLIVQHRSHISITDYTPGDCPSIENSYIYKENWKKYSVGIVYDEESHELRMIGGNPYHLQHLSGFSIMEDTTYDPFEPISIRLQNFPRDQLQALMIQFLIGTGEYEVNKNYSQLSCNAETGEGKTFCTIAMMTYLRVKTMIIVNRQVIQDTWVKEITKFTDADERKILRLDSKNIHEILEGKLDTKDYVAFVVIHRTLHNLGAEEGFETVHTLFKKLGIGLKVYDEAHREFGNTTDVDCYTNTWKTVYLTATLKLSAPKANYIYQYIFRHIPKFDQRKLGYTDAKKHIVMLAYFYNSHPTMKDQKRCYNARMHYFNARNHSMYQVEDDCYFFEILDANIKKMTIKNDFRTLILVSRIAACDEIKKFLRDNYPDLKIGVYNSSIDQKEKQRVLDEDQVIISTNSSLGESVTIKELRYVLNCEAHRNYGDQASGRLRKFRDKPDTICYYGELVDRGFKSILNQWKSRKKHYREIFKQIYEIQIN